MAIPESIDGVGDSAQKPRHNPAFDPTRAHLTSEDFYVFSRIDGTASLREIIVMVGLGAERGAAILRKLREAGAFLLGDETTLEVPSATPKVAPPPTELSADDLEADELVAMAETVALADVDKKRVILTMRAVRARNHYHVLGVESDCDAVAVKKAYFSLSKKFHPDRYYGKDTGSFGPWLSAIFEAATHAWETLSDERKRAAYDAQLFGTRGTGSQTRAEHAAQLFERGHQAESVGEYEEALMMFTAAIRGDEQPRYVRRAASAAIKAGKLQEAEAFARRGVELRAEDPSFWRVLADALRADGRLEEALEVLVKAQEIRTENDVLATEIASDLARLRRLLDQKE